ncbi:hypothetical protein [Agarivorans gilvus]|uniref:Uncharacterized protein n=1 Tax=Agarivorans gilvus TaxID=680279 RepID=A0ABQ1I7A0_9ALTE|nr:hypothetical protein [Agarivorans gilvus]GGB20241.1 hypothetical protein GCM10007414_37060 [Agarivorans gilvus]
MSDVASSAVEFGWGLATADELAVQAAAASADIVSNSSKQVAALGDTTASYWQDIRGEQGSPTKETILSPSWLIASE